MLFVHKCTSRGLIQSAVSAVQFESDAVKSTFSLSYHIQVEDNSEAYTPNLSEHCL